MSQQGVACCLMRTASCHLLLKLQEKHAAGDLDAHSRWAEGSCATFASAEPCKPVWAMLWLMRIMHADR